MAAAGSTSDHSDHAHDQDTDVDGRGTERTSDLRELDAHASYWEVYHACGITEVGHE